MNQGKCQWTLLTPHKSSSWPIRSKCADLIKMIMMNSTELRRWYCSANTDRWRHGPLTLFAFYFLEKWNLFVIPIVIYNNYRNNIHVKYLCNVVSEHLNCLTIMYAKQYNAPWGRIKNKFVHINILRFPGFTFHVDRHILATGYISLRTNRDTHDNFTSQMKS